MGEFAGHVTTDWIDECGEQEFLSWVCLGGAMHAVQARSEVLDWLDRWVFNAAKCFAVFHPGEAMEGELG